MRAKRILAVVLGLFVIAAIATIAMQSIRRPDSAEAAVKAVVPASPPALDPQPIEEAPPAAVGAMTVPGVKAEASKGAVAPSRQSVVQTRHAEVAVPAASHARKVVATYFHGNVRCATCRKVEAYAREAVEEGFPSQVAGGAVEFRTVNIEDPASRHFIDDFHLVNRSVVVTEEVDGVPAKWVKLDNVWGLVGDRAAYLAYVQDAVRGYLETQ